MTAKNDEPPPSFKKSPLEGAGRALYIFLALLKPYDGSGNWVTTNNYRTSERGSNPATPMANFSVKKTWRFHSHIMEKCKYEWSYFCTPILKGEHKALKMSTHLGKECIFFWHQIRVFCWRDFLFFDLLNPYEFPKSPIRGHCIPLFNFFFPIELRQ